ncbi:hypothetical protein AB0953_31775 [Streptomyces sp. NPDC046866]|uniref:hypothetical protein n=1 Tax=Streptomyces sp. NPDC046866 TaxID=3154921 RepID=UPI0034556F6A
MARTRVVDLVVVLPGIMGSRLASADGKAVWDLSGGALVRGLRLFGDSLGTLRLPKDTGDGHPGAGTCSRSRTSGARTAAPSPPWPTW